MGEEGRPTLEESLRILQAFSGSDLTSRIAGLEDAFIGASPSSVLSKLKENEIAPETLSAALQIKEIAGQINVIVHTVGILASLPYVMRTGERIESLSLGAGNTGRDFDLVTNAQLAEFKFITWRGSDPIRQNSIFADYYKLATFPDDAKRARRLYVLDKSFVEKFLGNRRALSSVMEKNVPLRDAFAQRFGTKYRVVADYYADHKDAVEIVDLRDRVPAFRKVGQ